MVENTVIGQNSLIISPSIRLARVNEWENLWPGPEPAKKILGVQPNATGIVFLGVQPAKFRVVDPFLLRRVDVTQPIRMKPSVAHGLGVCPWPIVRLGRGEAIYGSVAYSLTV